VPQNSASHLENGLFSKSSGRTALAKPTRLQVQGLECRRSGGRVSIVDTVDAI